MSAARAWRRPAWAAGRRPFRRGLAAGLGLALLAGPAVNHTPVADWLVAPLLVQEPQRPGQAEAIVVLGAGVIDDCLPNLNGVRRVLKAVRLWRAGHAPVLLFTGGTGGACPVSVAMSRLALEMGVPADRVRAETVSASTWENGVVTAALLDGWGLRRVLLVTDRLHMRRAAGVLTHLGAEVEPASVPIYEGHEDNVSMLQAGLREFAALAVYRLRGRLGPPDNRRRTAAPTGTRDMQTISNPGGPVVLLGASYAQGWPLAQVAGVPVLNRGREGQQSFELADRFEDDVVSAAPRAVILWGFINDIFRAPGDAGMEAVRQRVRDSYLRMIDAARGRGIEPILATEVTARPRAMSFRDTLAEWAGTILGREAYQDRVNRDVMALNEWIAEIGAREGLLVLDFQAVLSEPGGRRHKPFAHPDGSHISPAGYSVLTTYATPILEEHFGVR